MVNLERLNELEAWIDAQHVLPRSESEWNQRFWRLTPEIAEWAAIAYDSPATKLEPVVPSCGTAYCAAGFVAGQAGAVWPKLDPADADLGGWVLYEEEIDGRAYDRYEKHGYTLAAVSHRARRLLDIDLEWADVMFDSNTSYDEMKEYIAAIRAGNTYDEWYDEKYPPADDAE